MIARLPLAALCATAAACQAPPARGPVSEGTRALTVVSGWTESAPDSGGDIDAASARVGYARRFRDGFALAGELEVAHFDGPGSDGASVSTTGLGASGFLRWHALQGARWSAFLEYGLGLLATDEDFPPGGTSLNGLRQAGAGLSLELSQALRLTLGVRQQHVSNGRGLVDDNPSWDGFGAYVGLVFDVLPVAHKPIPTRLLEPVDAWDWSVGVEGRVGELEGESAGGGVFTLDGRLSGALFGQLRTALDDVNGESLTEWGGALYGRVDEGLFGVAYDRQDLDVFADDEFSLFGELYANDLVTAVMTLGHERRNQAADRVFGAVFLRVYPLDSLMVETGVAARDTYSDFGADSFDVPVGLEYGLPFPEHAGLSLFAQDSIQNEARVLGVRLRLGSSRGSFHPLRDRHRAAGPLRNRP